MNYRKILLVDDDADDQEIFLTALSQVTSDITCTAISSAVDALHKLTNKQISADVIFLDLNMPIMSGQQFLAEINKNPELKNIPVIIFSTSAHPPTIQLTKELGAKDFITKPDKYDDLIYILKTILI